METALLETLRYPIGKFKAPESYNDEMIKSFIKDIEDTPSNLRTAIEGLTDEQLDTRYRPEGWTVRQVVHHLPDSHMNSFIRFKLALTEDKPHIKGYEEQLWAELIDAFETPVSVSLDLLENLHTRWLILLKSFTNEDLEKQFIHPTAGLKNLKWLVALYSWHGRHHVAHITSLRERNGW